MSIIEFINRIIKSTFNAVRGIWFGFYSVKNLMVALPVAALIIWLINWLKLNVMQSAVILFSCTVIVIVEMINSAIEEIADMVHPKYNVGWGRVKDIMAGAVLLASVAAIAVGVAIIWEPLTRELAAIAAAAKK